MGIGEGKDKHDDHPRHLYRQGSMSSQLAEDLGLALEDGVPRSRRSVSSSRSSRSGLRTRTPSGKSVRSRTASRVEYHEDLKPSLKQGLTRNLLLMSVVILMGNSFLFGYNIGVLNQPASLIKDFFNTTYTARTGQSVSPSTITFLWSLTTTLFVPGGMIGAFSAGYLADKVGRKRAVLISHIPLFVGAIMSTLCVVAKAPELLMVGRFITGLACGFATQLAPMYLLEITPFNLKGAFGTLNQLFITLGIFLGSCFGLREILGTVSGWPYLLLLNCIPALFSTCILPFLPDSPRFLMLNRGNRIGTEKALRFLRQDNDVTADIEEMETECQDQELQTQPEVGEEYTMMRLLKSTELRMPLVVAIMLQLCQQLSGINAIFFYSSTIYGAAGVEEQSIQYAVIGTNAVNVAMTVIAVPIMDIAGRRPLLLYPMTAMVVVLGLITAALNLQDDYKWMSYISIMCVIAYVICFAVGLGPIPMMVGAELFRQAPRSRAMSLAGLANWLFTLVVAISFESIQEAIKEYTFIIFLVLMVFFTVFVYFKVPETKNKTFEEIASMFQPGGDIEVEEVIDDEDVFQESKFESTEEGTEPSEVDKLVNNLPREHRNGSVASGDRGSMEDIKIKMKGNGEKMSLTKSEENVCNLEV